MMSSKKRSERSDQGNDSPRTTIVGARPPQHGQPNSSIPRGIEKLLLLAYESEALRRELIENRAAMADSAGIELADSERAILESVPRAQIEAMIDNMPPPPPARREFLRRAAASTVALLGGPALAQLALTGCDDGPVSKGIRPDYPPGTEPEPQPEGTGTEPNEGNGEEILPPVDRDRVTRGIRPDLPPVEPPPPVQGIRPDVPPVEIPAIRGTRPDIPPVEPTEPVPEGTGEGTGSGQESVDEIVPEIPEHHDLSRGSRPDFEPR